MKLRPVLLLTGPMGPVPEVLVAYISSVIPSQLLPSDVLLDPAKPEFASTHPQVGFGSAVAQASDYPLFESCSLVRYLGAIEVSTYRVVAARLRALINV